MIVRAAEGRRAPRARGCGCSCSCGCGGRRGRRPPPRRVARWGRRGRRPAPRRAARWGRARRRSQRWTAGCGRARPAPAPPPPASHGERGRHAQAPQGRAGALARAARTRRRGCKGGQGRGGIDRVCSVRPRCAGGGDYICVSLRRRYIAPSLARARKALTLNTRYRSRAVLGDVAFCTVFYALHPNHGRDTCLV